MLQIRGVNGVDFSRLDIADAPSRKRVDESSAGGDGGNVPVGMDINITRRDRSHAPARGRGVVAHAADRTDVEICGIQLQRTCRPRESHGRADRPIGISHDRAPE